MQKIVYRLIFMGTLLFSTQVTLADTSVEENKEDKVKELKVEDGATKIGEDIEEDKVATRSLSMSLRESNNSENNTNVHIGKIEFYVK